MNWLCFGWCDWYLGHSVLIDAGMHCQLVSKMQGKPSALIQTSSTDIHLGRLIRLWRNWLVDWFLSKSSHHWYEPCWSFQPGLFILRFYSVLDNSCYRALDAMHSNSGMMQQRVMLAASRRYPTHQPRYNGVGILPNVQLKQPMRLVLTDHNSSMLRVSNTIKIAPPDVLKPPVPR